MCRANRKLFSTFFPAEADGSPGLYPPQGGEATCAGNPLLVQKLIQAVAAEAVVAAVPVALILPWTSVCRSETHGIYARFWQALSIECRLGPFVVCLQYLHNAISGRERTSSFKVTQLFSKAVFRSTQYPSNLRCCTRTFVRGFGPL